MSNSDALGLSLMRNALGQKEFPDITMMGGTLEGYAGDCIAVRADRFQWWHRGAGERHRKSGWRTMANVVVDASREASLQMSDSPSDLDSTDNVTMVSMFQTNSVALRAERWINWKLRRDDAVAVIDHVGWGALSS